MEYSVVSVISQSSQNSATFGVKSVLRVEMRLGSELKTLKALGQGGMVWTIQATTEYITKVE